jgi:hypothetical protein
MSSSSASPPRSELHKSSSYSSRQDEAARICNVCKEDILPSQRTSMSVRGKDFHRTCMVCDHCKVSLSGRTMLQKKGR